MLLFFAYSFLFSVLLFYVHPSIHPLPIIRSSPNNKYESNRKGENKNRASYPAQSNGLAGKANGTLESSKSKRNTLIRQSASHGNLTDEQTMDFLYNTGDRGQVKRTKSFWKFGKSDTEDIVEGMAMWKHRDLIQPEHEMRMEEERIRETTLKRNKNKSKPKAKDPEMEKEKVKPRSTSTGRVKEMQQNITVPIIDDHAKYQLTKAEIDQRIGKTKERYHQEDVSKTLERNSKVVRESETELGYAEDEDDMTMEDSLEEGGKQPTMVMHKNGRPNLRMQAYEGDRNLNNKLANKYYDDMMMSQDMEDERFYDDESLTQEVVVMKTVKRKEILKQYYSSGTSDTERHSSSSDPYDCIVVQDQHLMRNKNNIFNNNTNNRKNNKNKEMTTFRGEFAMNKNNMDTEQQATKLPRTKLMKNDPMDGLGTGKKSSREMTMAKVDQAKKKPQNVDPKSNDKRKNFDESKRNSLSSAKSYGPWYDLWGASPNNPNNNNTLISQK